MKLYHGTSEKAALAALNEGLKPRGKSKGHWQHSVLSRSDAVYLTAAYAMYFAIHAAKGGERMAIIEVETDRLNPYTMAPDEDCLGQINQTREHHPDLPEAWEAWDLMKKTRYFRKRLDRYTGAGQWLASIKALGNCCHLGPIFPGAITRVAFIDKGAEVVRFTATDPSISVMNYQFVGHKYRGLTKWIFGDDLGEDGPRMHFSTDITWADIPDSAKEAYGSERTFESMRYDYMLPPDEERQFIEVMEHRNRSAA
jgi:hypothetical protein